MKCPVCKTECGNGSTCPECGFEEVGKLFINQEDAAQWLDGIVEPLRRVYVSKTILPQIDWGEVFRKEIHTKALFEITIPAAQKRQNVLGHILLKSTNELIDRHFIDEVCSALGRSEPARVVTINNLMKPGDLINELAGLRHGSIALFSICGNIKKEIYDILLPAIREFTIPVVLGKGEAAKRIQLDIAEFTAILIAKKNNDIPADLVDAISSIIEPDFSEQEILEYRIREHSAKYKVALTYETLEILKNNAHTEGVQQMIRLVSDYLFLHQEIKQPITGAEMRSILKAYI